ncbi:MAG: hypothetical protein FWH45_00870, partial [Methanomassiliicoccaceae archaeon]|nr:hypothetical protein [Methanomassiliicoccaceae archaeon]
AVNNNVSGTNIGTITGDVNGVRLGVRGTVNNAGWIEGTDYGVLADASASIDNDGDGLTTGVITGADGVYIGNLAAGDGINNTGLIEGTAGNGIEVAAGDDTYIVNDGGIIAGDDFGIYLNVRGDIDNTNGGIIGGTNDDGIYLAVGGEIYNEDLIVGGINGIYALAGAVTLEHWGTVIGNVLLSNGTNAVTFAGSSGILGNFNIGSNVNSTLNFVGTPTQDPATFEYTYATVAGTANIGTAEVLGASGLPGGYSGQTLILIDAALVTGVPSNDTITVPGYIMDLSIRNNDQLIAAKAAAIILEYIITATSDGMTSISPEGKISVVKGDDMTFTFSADAESHITEVIVDGVYYLSQAVIDSGSYTFHNVNMNHSIQVMGERGRTPTTADRTLTIEVVEGNGHALYRVGVGPFERYTAPVSIPRNADVTIRAVADSGYKFEEWREGGTVYKTSDVTFYSVVDDIYADLYFSEDNTLLWWILGALLILAAGFLIWFLFFYRRTYEVIKVVKAESKAAIIGKERARRKRPYCFTIEGGSYGKVSYRVGEDGHWKDLIPDENGEYVIPKEDVIDRLVIEHR